MWKTIILCVAGAGAWCLSAAAQPCDVGEWSRDFPDASFTLQIRAVTTFDDGSGPSLYAGGDAGFRAFPHKDNYASAPYLGRWSGGPLWERVGGLEPNFPVDCFTAFDDDSGPALYVGGEFSRIGDLVIRRVGKWDGKSWSPLASGLKIADPFQVPSVRAMAVFDDGAGPALYAGGYFNSTGDGATPLAHIARWDGQAWHDVGGGLVPNGEVDLQGVYALTVFDDGSGPALYAAGSFLQAGGQPIAGLARWDGKAWSAPWEPLTDDKCPECPAVVRAMAVFDDGDGPALWVGGHLQAPGVPFTHLARLRNGKWEAAGQLFEHNASDDAGHLAIRALAVHDDGSGPGLYVGGTFATYPLPKGQMTGGCVAKWDRSTKTWTDMNGNPRVHCLSSENDQAGRKLWVGGQFDHAGGKPNVCVAAIGPDGWEAVGDGRGAPTRGVAVFDDGRGPAVYLAGGCRVNGVEYRGIIRYGPDGWSNVGDLLADVDPTAQSIYLTSRLRTLDLGAGPALYAFADFDEGLHHGAYIVRWDGQHWSALGQKIDKNMPGADSPRLFAYDDGSGMALYLGTHDEADIYKLDHGQWVKWADADVGNNGGAIYDAVEFDDGSGPALWVGGQFKVMEGLACSNIARYRRGSGWEAVGEGMDSSVLSVTVWDDGSGPALYASGSFTTAGGKVVNRVARWDGQTWHALGAGLGGGYGNQGGGRIYPWNDGNGPGLYAFGSFSTAGGLPVGSIAKWDGQAWSPLGEGASSFVTSLADADLGNGPILFASGNFFYAGGYPSPGFGAWTACPREPCPADLDSSGSLDLFDFLTFLNLFNAQDPRADCDADSAFTLADFTCYTTLFAAGCP